MGAEWIIPFDADELWCSVHGRLSEIIPHSPTELIEAKIWDHRPDFTDNPDDPNPYTRMPYSLVEPLALPKVAFKAKPEFVVAQGNHDVFELDADGVPVEIGSSRRNDKLLQVRHVPYRSFEQLERKVRQGARAYEASDLPLYQGDHWRTMGQETDEQLSARWEQMYEWERVYLPAPYKGTWSSDE
jgi:hypothetical protein